MVRFCMSSAFRRLPPSARAAALRRMLAARWPNLRQTCLPRAGLAGAGGAGGQDRRPDGITDAEPLPLHVAPQRGGGVLVERDPRGHVRGALVEGAHVRSNFHPSPGGGGRGGFRGGALRGHPRIVPD